MRPLVLAFEQLPDPRLLRPLAASLALAVLCLAGTAAAVAFGLHHALAGHPWLASIASAAGVVGTALLSVWLFFPLALAIAGLFLESVARAVERRHYPALPPAQGAPISAQLWDGLALGLLVLGLQLVALVLALALPGVGLVAGLAITAWGVARGLFVAVAMRRMSRAEARRAYAARRPQALLQGAVLAALGTVPVADLLVPILGVAVMVHVLHGGAPRRA